MATILDIAGGFFRDVVKSYKERKKFYKAADQRLQTLYDEKVTGPRSPSVLFHLQEYARPPTQGYEGDAGWDLYSDDDFRVEPGATVMVSTGVRVALPTGFWAHLVARSSTARKGLRVQDAVIDNGYRGELFIIAHNFTDKTVTVAKGERIAQLILHRTIDVGWHQVSSLPPSERGTGGFGSTG